MKPSGAPTVTRPSAVRSPGYLCRITSTQWTARVASALKKVFDNPPGVQGEALSQPEQVKLL